MDLVQAMRIFSRVAETGNFTKAAEQLDLSVVAVTRSIAGLEKHLNVRLLNRTTRRVALTDIGQSYLEGCRAALEQIEDAERNVARTTRETQGVLRILAGTPFSLTKLALVLTSYREKYPHIQVQLTLSDREVDFIEEGFDAAILADYMVGSDKPVTRPLMTYTYAIVAARSYLNTVGEPQRPDDLRKMCFIGRSADTRGYALQVAAEPGVTAGSAISLIPSFVCNNAMMLHQLVKEGMGFAILPTVFVEDELRSGKFVACLAGQRIVRSDVDVCLVYPSRKFINRKLRTFIDHVVDEFSYVGQ
jgi:DNA-binding transcriptional LysR family regulator